MNSKLSLPEWFQAGLTAIESEKDNVGVVLVANLKGRTVPIDDYEADSIATEFLSTQELDDFISGFEQAGIYCEVVLDETGFLDWLKHGLASFGRKQPIVYNVTQNGTGPARFSLVPGLCRLNRLPLVDSDAYVTALGQHKFHCMMLLQQFGLPIARSWWFTNYGWWPHRPPNDLKVIAKPTLDSASIGINADSVFFMEPKIEEKLQMLVARYRQSMTIQEFVPGFEVEVPVLEAQMPKAWMSVGIELAGKRELGDTIMHYGDVYADKYGFYDFSSEDSKAALAMRLIAEKAHVGLGFVGTSRIDFRVTRNGEPKIMEVTCKPHLTKHSSFSHAIASMGIPYSHLLKFLVGAALTRFRTHQSEAHTWMSLNKKPRP